MPTPPDFIANFDSASAMARATAAFLRGEDFPALGESPLLIPPASQANLLPRWLRAKLYIFSGWQEAIPPKQLTKIDPEDLSRWLADEYPERDYPAVAIGSSSGAMTHLYTALGIPWLPQTFLIPVRQRVHPDDPTSAMELGLEPGAAFLERNPDWQLHHMHDANQDRLMVRAMTYFRVKRRNLGPVYEQFLRERLPEGGTILLVDCRRTWDTTRVSDRHVFQHGALGGATPEEFHRGSERVAEYLERYDSPVRRWEGPEPDTTSPEAEWGYADELTADIERIAAERGYRVRRVLFDEPEDPSPLVADLYRWWYRRRRIPANRLLVSSFIVMEPHWTLRTGSVPYWMKFNMKPSLEAINRYLDEVDPYDEIYLTLFAHGVEAVGLPAADEWRAVLARARKKGATLGADLSEYPMDFPQYARYYTEVKKLPSSYPLPGPLSLAELDAFLGEHGERYPVRWQEGARAREHAIA
jgi:hypothetical protein